MALWYVIRRSVSIPGQDKARRMENPLPIPTERIFLPMMTHIARLAMIDLSPQEEAQLAEDLEQMTAFGERLAQWQEDEADE